MARVHSEMPEAEVLIDWEDLIMTGLVMQPDAAERRMKMGNLLGIGYGNGKQFHKRLRIFGISREEFATALSQMEAEEEQ